MSERGIGSEVNWAGNITYGASRLLQPERTEDVQQIVREGGKLKVLGARHSFSDVADSRGTLLSLDRMPQEVTVDAGRRSATVSAALRYGQLCRALDAEGLAVHNTASLPHISVAGACSTATHGSGDGNGNLATAVSGIELVLADGSLVTLTREADGAIFPGAVVALGGLGVVTRVTLDVVPAFAMRQYVYEWLPLAELEAHFDEVTASAYSVSLFTDWQTERINQVWLKALDSAGPAPAGLFGAVPATTKLHPLVAISPEACTPQLGAPGPWYDRLPHFRIEFTPSSGEELQSEYFVPRRHAVAALRAVYGLRRELAPLLQIAEVRTIAADDLWLSPCYGQACVAFHFTWIKDWPGVGRLLPRVEDALAPFDARPHWGKLFTVSPQRLGALYPRLPDFRDLLRTYDPQGTFRNPYLERTVFGANPD
ncbi:MAG TPA: D-arabinono-1,4-lactone oxidase [Chloroflexota bacterium]|nr:D-arabinono-1,4-lactone oxidase [Chloroflexota bacterium]